MDNTYLERIKLRREIMESHPEATLACNEVAEPAALELYTWLTGTYLPKRFPTCFALVSRSEDDTTTNVKSTKDITHDTPTHLLNKITSEPIPLHPTDPLKALQTLSSHIDTDFLILLPSHPQEQQQQQTQPTYTLQAFATTFPSGFSTRSKLSLPLAAIHAPVPSYAAKLEKSMDRFFARLEPGKLVRRANWTITTSPDLFAQSGTHMRTAGSSSSSDDKDWNQSGDESNSAESKGNANANSSSTTKAAAENEAEETEAATIAHERLLLSSVPISAFRLRCERQTLHRLPRTGALVFAFKTYAYGLEEVKAEEEEEEGGRRVAEALAEATEGFARGSAPGMRVYKREAVWGERVRGFLRG